MKILKENVIDQENDVIVSRVVECKDTVDEVMENCGVSTCCLVVSLIDESNPMNGCNPCIKAIARCTSGDAFDEDKGMDVANTKADLKYHKRMVHDYDKYIKRMKKAIEDIETLQKVHSDKVQVIEKGMEEFYE